MKRLILIALFLCVAVSAQAGRVVAPAPAGQGTYLEIGGPLTHDSTYNVKDFGAKGDGVTRDNAAIIAALDFAVARWTADNSARTTIYFPAGDYALLHATEASTPDGIDYDFPNGFGNLTLLGDGGAVSRLLWTGANELAVSSTVFALYFKPTASPPTAGQYLHDIVFADIGVSDDDPDAHERNPPTGEETHGFYVAYCNRLTYDGVMVDSVGDESTIARSSSDVLFNKCIYINELSTTEEMTGVNIMEGCENVVVSNCRMFSDISSQRGGFGVHIETQDTDLNTSLSGITIVGNTIQNSHIGIGLFNANGDMSDISMSANIISNCDAGIQKTGVTSTYAFKNISIASNIITTVHSGIAIFGSSTEYIYMENIGFTSNIITDVSYSADTEASDPGVGIKAGGVNLNFSDNIIDGCEYAAVLLGATVGASIRGGKITTTNTVDQTVGGFTWANVPGQGAAVAFITGIATAENVTVDGVVFLDCVKSGVGANISVVQNCDISLREDATTSKWATNSIKFLINNTLNHEAYNPIDGCQYLNNRFINSGDPGEHWLELNSVDGGLFSNNYFEMTGGGSSRYAIWSKSTTTNCIITGNNATNNSGGTWDFYFESAAAGGIVFRDNIGRQRIDEVDLAVGDAIPVLSAIKVEGTPADVICTATPSIADGMFIGQEMTILGEDNTNHWTLQSGSTFNTNLGAATRQLDVGSVLVLKWDGALWQEVLYSA